MGVRGLATYVRRSSAGKSITFDSSKPRCRVVVDGWALVFHLYRQAGIDAVCGGNFRDFSDAIQALCETWRRLGLIVTVVWDGELIEP